MARLATRATVPTLAISLVLALVAGSALALHGRTAPAKAQQVTPSDRASVVSAFFDAEVRGDVDAAVAQLADNGVFISARATGNCSQQAPCTDLASIRQNIQGTVAVSDLLTIRAIQVSGAVVTGQRETRSDLGRRNGIDRVLGTFIALVPRDKITFFANLDDAADPETALNAAITAGTQPVGTPIPNPATPCAGVSGA